jgi:site-specific DNA-methyltransferase (adenine-specific)
MTTRQHYDLIKKYIKPTSYVNKLFANIPSSIVQYHKINNMHLFQENSLKILAMLPKDSIDVIFADPPYLLSNNGFTCQSGMRVSVNKGKWDKSKGLICDLEFHDLWINACKRVLKPNGTIWISGTYHNIYICGYLLQKNNFHILNDISWFKPNASPNLSCRFFTASHETLIWARKDKKGKHTFNYQDIKNGNFPEDKLKKENTQMRSVWCIPTPKSGEKEFGKHPTQKPLALLKRIILASTNEEDIVLDPFCGSGTTGIACKEVGDRKFIGIEIDGEYFKVAQKRLERIIGNVSRKKTRIILSE